MSQSAKSNCGFKRKIKNISKIEFDTFAIDKICVRGRKTFVISFDV